jgi:outer membrane biosynthesis protein TonB
MTETQLTDPQINFLLSGIRPERIGKDGKGFAHVEAWDIRRHLIRVFGFGGYDTDQQEMTLVAQIEHKPSNPNGKSRWTVIYRATVVLTVKVGGVELGHWHGTAMGDAPNLPSLADAHDMAMKTADSQALKRAAVNLGDAFGLSLYNDGSLTPVVLRSLAYMAPTAPAQPEQEDTPVRPEPQPAASPEPEPTAPPVPAAAPPRPAPAPTARPAPVPAPSPEPSPAPPGEDPEDWAAALAEMEDAAAQANFTAGLPAQFKTSFGHPIEQGTTAEYRQARDLILGQSAAA